MKTKLFTVCFTFIGWKEEVLVLVVSRLTTHDVHVQPHHTSPLDAKHPSDTELVKTDVP